MRRDASSAADLPDEAQASTLKGFVESPRGGVRAPARNGAVRLARRPRDAASLLEAERLFLQVMYAVCALAAVLVADDLLDLGSNAHPTTLWAALFPALVLLAGPGPVHRFTSVRLVELLQFIGLSLRTTLLLLLLALALFFAGAPSASLRWLACVLLLHVAACTAVRLLARSVIARPARALRIAIVGADAHGLAVARHLLESAADVELLGFFDDRRSRIEIARLPAPMLGTTADLLRQDWGVEGVVIALPGHANARIDALSATLRASAVDLYLAPHPSVLHRSPPRRQSGGLEAMVLLGAERLPLPGRIAKRAFDIVFSAVALLCFAPFGLLIAALIRLESPGPVIFRQKRYGLDNRLFEVYKFRSMRFEPAAQAGEIRLTEHGDSRVTVIGNFLRRTSLDEFPQFLNVLQGHMSVVGPRPHPPGVKAGGRTYEDVVDDFMERYKLRPGITGWAQVNGLRGNTFTESHLTSRFAYDLQYIRNWSFSLDVLIVIRTVVGGFGGENAF